MKVVSRHLFVTSYFRSSPITNEQHKQRAIMSKQTIHTQTACYHCGEDCGSRTIIANEKSFCCEGCKMVYEIINQSGLCDYYAISKSPGSSQKISVRKDKFSFFDDDKIRRSLISFSDETQTHITFYLPQMHCSSCLWLLENYKNNTTIKSARYYASSNYSTGSSTLKVAPCPGLALAQI
jgi:Putative metal-binding domain of cation transport ATPase